MTEHRYQIQVSTQLGMRRGDAHMDRTGQRIAGDAALSAPGKSVFRAGLLCRSARLFRPDPDPCLPHFLSGRLRSGRQRPDGHFPHGIRRLLHRRGSVRAGKHPQRRNDLSPLSALLWQNHRCFTPPKSRKSFFLAAKSPSVSVIEAEGLCLLYLCFLLTLLRPSHNHLRGFLIAAWAGAKIAERSSLHLLYAITLNLIAFFQIRHGSEDLQRM